MKNFGKKIAEFFKEYGHRIFTFCVGLAFIGLVFFCIGLVLVRIYGVFVPSNIYSNKSFEATLYGGSVYEAQTDEQFEEGTKEFFEDYIENMIRQDMPDFEDPEQLNDEYIISFGLWQAIKLNNSQGVYNFDKKGNFRVPKADVEKFALYCFDFPRKIDHRSTEICGEFKYNVLNRTYKIRSSGVQTYLIPDVVDVKTGQEDTYELTVDCYEAGMMSQEDPRNDPDNLYKRVKITLQDMGIQDYTAVGDPVHRYIVFSMKTVEIETEQVKNDLELN